MSAKPLWTDPQKMEEAINAYFESCEGTVLLDPDGVPYTDKQGRPIIVNARPLTIPGLAYALGFASRQSLFDYQKKKAFKPVITRAKLRIEAYTAEKLLDRDAAPGARFSLACNFGWVMPKEDRPAEKAETQQTGVILIPEISAPPAEERTEEPKPEAASC